MPVPQTRHFIDPETGEISRIETTKEAKRRYLRGGGAQWRPTKGQMNAADIWNKQEEKILRDRKKEDNRKRANLRNAQREAQLKQRQQERLAKGEISVEDTWGKVSSSQVRLNKFFLRPNAPSQGIESGDDLTATKELEQNADVVLPTERAESCPRGCLGSISLQQPDCSSGVYPLNAEISQQHNLFNDGTLIPRRLRGAKRRRITEGESDWKTADSAGAQDSSLGKGMCEFDPQTLQSTNDAYLMGVSNYPPLLRISSMPPPPRVIVGHNVSQTFAKLISGSAGHTQSHVLRESSASHTNIMAGGKLCSNVRLKDDFTGVSRAVPPISTQIVQETLKGLSSQDLIDDFDEMEQEAQLSPQVSKPISCGRQQGSMLKSSPALEQVAFPKINDDSHCPHATGQESDPNGHSMSQNNYDFNDDEIDDEMLTTFAATQQLRRELQASTETPMMRQIVSVEGEINAHGMLPTDTAPKCTSMGPKLDDSFAMHSIDDDDLLRCMQSFENVNQDITDDDLTSFMNRFDETHSEEVVHNHRMSLKKSRVLPWVKQANTSIHDQDSDIPLSQKTDILDESSALRSSAC